MPILWRYLTTQYIKIFIFCTLTFVAILLTSRLDDIARFATLGPGLPLILKFTFLQIPYILPIAIPLSCLISAVIIFQRLSTSHELTALRAAGLSIRTIFFPILLIALLLSTLNFYTVSELATSSHLQTSLLKNEIRSVNPLLLIRNKHLMRSKGYYFDTLGNTAMGESASKVVLATPNSSGERINLLIADEFNATTSSFSGEHVTIFTTKQEGANGQEQIVIENVDHTETSIEDFMKMVEKKVWSLNNDHLTLPFLMIRLSTDWKTLNTLKQQQSSEQEIKHAKKNFHKSCSELLKRFSVGLAPLTFTLLGASFALSISRYRSNRSNIAIVCLAALYLICFFAAQGFSHQIAISTTLYFAPHLFIIGLSWRSLVNISKGYESKVL